MNSKFNINKTRDKQNTLDLRYGVWPSNNKFSKYILFANGRTEWIEKYHYLPQDLHLPEDVGFVTWDHRGQGDSGGARAIVDTYDSYAQDAKVIANLTTEHRPYVGMGHSMGGLIMLYATLKGYIKPKALVLSSPLLRLPEHVLPNNLARPISKIISAFHLGAVSTGAGSHTKGTPFEDNHLTHDYGRFAAMGMNPYPIPGATFGWVNQTFAALEEVYSPALLKNLKIPVLVMNGSEETVVDQSGFRDWVKAAQKHSSAKVVYRIVPGAKHELYSEIAKYYDSAIALTRDWFSEFIETS